MQDERDPLAQTPTSDEFEEFTVAASMVGGALLAGVVIALIAWVWLA